MVLSKRNIHILENNLSFINLESSWKEKLEQEFHQSYMKKLKIFLQQEQSKYTTYPKNKDIFNAFFLTPFDNVKVVILGQDPYHGPNQAHGLAFSTLNDIAPPSLINIFKELQDDLSIKPLTTNLSSWAHNGVLLLNSVLSVRSSVANSHANQGWEVFTSKVIELLSSNRENIVFILWGSYAQKNAKFINQDKHYIISSPHPSPLSSYRGFFGSKPFSKTNNYLVSRGLEPVSWNLE